MTSCSGPLSSRGDGSPRSAAAWRRMPKPNAWWVRASGSVEVRASRAVTRWRSAAAASRVDVRSRHWSGTTSPASTRPTTSSTAVVRLAGAGAAEDAQHRAAVRDGSPLLRVEARGGDGEAGARRRVSTRPIPSSAADSLRHASRERGQRWRSRCLSGPAQRAAEMSTRRPERAPPTSGVPSWR